MDYFIPNFIDSSFGVHLHHPNFKPLGPRGNHSTSSRNHFTLVNSYHVCLYRIFHYPDIPAVAKQKRYYCVLELWYNKILVLLTGNLRNAEVEIDALSIW
ncbi:hypothetical protein HN51_050820 [Arachis hypogaea]